MAEKVRCAIYTRKSTEEGLDQEFQGRPMKVQCIRLADTVGRPQSRSNWLTIGQTYSVLSIIQDTHKRWLFRLALDDGPALFQIELFEITDNTIPCSWVVVWHGDTFELTPKSWTQPGFWDRFYEKDPDAVELFDSEAKTILQEDSNDGGNAR